MIEIPIKGAVETIRKSFGGISPALLNKATARAINRVMEQGRAVAIKEIRREYNIDPKYFKDRIGNKNNRYNALKAWKAYPNNLTGKLLAYGKPIPLVAFPFTQTDKGVDIQVKKGKTVFLRRVFPVTMKSGHKALVDRGKYDGNRFQPRSKRLKQWPKNDLGITQIMTTSLQEAIVQPSILKMMEAKVKENIDKRIIHEVKYLLSKM